MIGVSEDTRSQDSLQKVFVRKVREMVVAVNGINTRLVRKEGC